nr:hypothetical protein [Tanacetum cinerariifolium]
VDIALIRKRKKDNIEIMDKQKQTPRTTPLDSLGLAYLRRKPLLLNWQNQQLNFILHYHAKHIWGVVAKVTKCINKMIKTMKKIFVHQSQVQQICQAINDTFEKGVFHELRKQPISLSRLIFDALSERKCIRKQQAYIVLRKRDHDDHPDGSLEAEKNAKKLNTTLGANSAKDDDEVVYKEATPEFLAELKFLGKAKEPTTAESQRMKDFLDNMMRERCDIVEKYVYHLEQAKNYMENQIIWGSREQKLTPQEPEKEALVFLSPQRNPNEPPRFLWNKYFFYLKN